MDLPRETVLPLPLAESNSQSLYKESIKCSVCGTERDPDLLHLSREEKETPSRVEIPEKSKRMSPNALPYAKAVQMDSYAAKSYWLAYTSKTGLTTRYITRDVKSPIEPCETPITG